MYHRPHGSLEISTSHQIQLDHDQAFDKMFFERRSDLSPSSINDYIVTGKYVLRYFEEDPAIADLDRDDWIGSFNYLTKHIGTPEGIAPRAQVHLRARLHDPTALRQQRIDVLAGKMRRLFCSI